MTCFALIRKSLLELGAIVGHGELLEAARVEWERYVAALPLAFADHAARFYLRTGRKPARALELARVNFQNRPNAEARALVVEAALAAGEPQAACAEVEPLVSRGTRASGLSPGRRSRSAGERPRPTGLAASSAFTDGDGILTDLGRRGGAVS